ncbi:hypothetical protein Pfo_008754 [Paulownia fortunei]|nr:hypothetical protein Pfo_008754 [Paulownia fortunei]
MFFNDFIRRRLATLLQPWLRGDQELEFKLDFLRSNGTLNNISFNTSALNELLDDPSKFCFKEATVEHLSLQFSPFSSAAFTLVVRGLRVVLSLGEEEDEGGVKWRRKPRDTTVEERNKVLEEIDPEGCALHGAIKKISDITTRRWRTSLLNTVIRHCHLQLHDVHVLLQSPCLSDPFSCSLYMKKFGAGSRIIGHGCFIRGFMSSLFVPFEESSFDVDINSFEIRLNSENRKSSVFPATNMFALVNLNHLQSISFCFHVPALNFLFSPADLSVILLLYGLLSKEYKCARRGRQLWNIVATKISSLLPTSKLSLIKVVRIVCLWLRYINTYQRILLLVGYPADEIMKRSATLMFQDTMYSRSVRSQWNLIAEMENDLPLEAIAVARRLTRYRVASNGPGKNCNFDELLATRPFLKLRQLLVLILSMIGSLLVSFMRILFLHKLLAILPESSPHFGSVHENSPLQQSVTLKVQEISVSVFPDNAVQPSISGKAVSGTEISFQDLLSFKFSIDAFFLRYMVNISEQHFTFASGRLKVFSFSTASSYSEEHQKKEVDKRQIVVWGEPAQIIYFPEATRDNATDDVARTSVPHLDRLLGKLWLNWKDACLKSEGENIPNVQAPWILCDIWSCLIDHGSSDSSSRFNCSLGVGKLNFNLEYYSLASTVVLLRQIQCALCWSLRKKNVVLHSPAIIIEDPPVRYWSSQFASFSSKIEMDIIRMLPEKHVQIGALIAGPHIQISLLNDRFHAETTNPHHLVTQVLFEICNIEFLVSPNLKDNVGLSSENASESDRGSECLGLKEPEEIDISKSDNGAYSCQGQISINAYLNFNGLKAYFGGTTENQKHQIIVLRPTTTQLGYVRKDHHSFGSSVVAVSAASHWVATGFSCLLFLDELYVVTKIVFGVFYETLAFTMDGSGGDLSYEELSSRETIFFESECGQTFSVGSKQASLVTNPQVFVNSTCELKSFDMILHNSRKSCSLETHMSMMPIDRETGRKSALHDTSSNGIYITIQKSMVEFMFKGWNMDVVIDITGAQCIIFKYLTEYDGTSDKSELKNLLCSLNFLTEASVYHSKLCFCLRNLEKALPLASLHSTADESTSHGITFHMWGDSPLIVSTERLGNHWLFGKIVISGIYMAGCQVKDILVNAFEEFHASYSVGGDFQAISCECKGGSMLLEATALTMFIECFTSYYQWISELWPSGRSSSRVVVAQYISEMALLDGQPSVNPQQVQRREVMWDRLEAFTMSLLHLSVVLVERDESGRLQELLFEVDFQFRLELLNTVRKMSISISKFSMLSQFMHGDLGHKATVIRTPFSSIVPDNSLSSFISKDSSPSLQHKDSIHPDLADASGPSTSVSQRGSHVGISMSNPAPKNLYISPQKYILTDLRCFLAVEGPVTRGRISPAYSNNIWVGSGSISGFDMTISLYEIKMVLSAFESCSKVLSREGASKVESSAWSYNQEPGGSMEEMVPDGTIVAIQDIDQHMYIAVGGTESGYDTAGAIHYSLVGERALFRVKYHKPRIWKPQVQYFSLISLYGKDNSGESLRLNCRPRSRFVDISCSNDSGSALWRMLPFKPDAYEDAIKLASSNSLSKRAFHLVNKKNDCAVAFTDGILEFVSKPGNLFKWKVFDDPGPVGNNLLPKSYIMEGSSSATSESRELQSFPRTGTDSRSDSNVTDKGEFRTNGKLLGITVKVDKVTLTIVHELSDTEEKFPLLQGSIIPNQTIIQITNFKVRVMNTFEVILNYFDAQQNSWKEFIQPLEICIFYSQKFLIQGAENSLHGVPSHFYAKIKEVTVLLSELSLDILLFVIGKLDLAGPYAVKSSVVLANCCKVENQSGLTLVCQFYDNQVASISARQPTTIFLRHQALANQPPEASFCSVQLVQQGCLSTSPIHLSFLEARQFAWRTRIVSSQDSKSFPGPFIVVEISKGIEDGLSIVVSPLLKIHNETDFSLELRFHRPQQEETESALLILKAGDVLDDAMTAFSAIDLSGGLRKALTSLNVGNYEFSFRPNIADGSKNFEKSSVEWSDDLKGGKPVRLSGLFDKLSYQVRKAFSVNSIKFSLSSANCALKSEEGFVANIYFLIQTVGKAIPVVSPDNFGYAPGNRNSPVAMQEQKEIFVLPTIQVSNLLHTEIHVSLTERDPHSTTMDCDNTWSQATISCGSAANFYANPSTIYFVVTLTCFGSSCKPVNSRDWVRKLQKQKGDVTHLDIKLDFGGGKYFAMLRLSRGHRGTLQAGIFTSYALQNHTNAQFLCFPANQKTLSRGDMERFGTGIPLELGSYLPPNSITSWFLKCHKLRFKLLEEKALEAQLDLDVLSGLTEIDLEAEELFGSKDIMRLGVSLRPPLTKEVSSQIVSFSSRYVVCNESEDMIAIRQCYMEDMEELIAINSKQRIALRLKTVISNKKETNVIENILRKHTKSQYDSSFFIQFRPNETGIGWSGPVCVASLGRFFLKFRKSLEFPESQSGNMSYKDNLGGFAAVHVVEEGSTIVLHFHRPPVTNLPYKIENCLHDAAVTYYQKGSSEPETLGVGFSVNYVWDDLTLPHKLVVQLDDVHLLCEINLDKVRSWKPFYRNKQTRGVGFHLPLDKKPEDQKRTTYSRLIGSETVKVGFEVYAEGVTRVLRICEFSDSHKVNMVSGFSRKMRLRIPYFSVHLLEHALQEVDLGEPSNYAPIIITRVERINWDAIFTDQHKCNQIRVQSLSVDEKWVGAPFAAMLRRHQSEKSDANDYILHVAVVLLPTSSCVKQVKYFSIVLQPLDLNLDEETLMKIVPFWRRSLSDLSTPRQQYYFDHFEIHPIKIVASFLPGDSHYSYSSTQETLRSLLHSVIKIPAIKTKTVELNGVLVTHALITLRELTIKCAQHYSWYAMRAIYIAKGSPLLPPAFASIFDDLASSSLDVFFDPSTGLLNLPGVTLGTLKLISKFIHNKGFSGTKRYFGDLGKTLKTAGSNMLFVAVTEISDSVLKGAETSGFNGMVNGFHQGILKLAMQPSVLGSAFMEGGPDRKIKLDRSPGVDELYIEGYLQAMLDTMYNQEYLRVRVIENQVVLKNLPPSSSLIDEIMENVKGFLASKALLKGESSTAHSLRHIRGEREWRIGPTILTLCEHLFVSFMIRVLRKQSGKVMGRINWKEKLKADEEKKAIVPATSGEEQKVKLVWKWGIGKFVLSGIVAYIDGRLCRNIPNPLARRIVSGFLLSFLDQSSDETKQGK